MQDQIINWIKNSLTKNFSEQQITQTLTTQGYTLQQALDLIRQAKTETQTINQQVKPHTAIKLLLFIILPILILAQITLPFIQGFVNSGNMGFYIITSIYSLILGFISAHIFNKISGNTKEYLLTGVILSTVLSITYAINVVIISIISKLNAQMSKISQEGATQGLSSLFSNISFNPYIAFTLALIFFNAPYFFYYLKKQDRNEKQLIPYLIPVITFIVLSLILMFLLNNVIFHK